MNSSNTFALFIISAVLVSMLFGIVHAADKGGDHIIIGGFGGGGGGGNDGGNGGFGGSKL